MSVDLWKGSYTSSKLKCHVVWVTKYRFKVLKGVASSDNVRMHIEYASKYDYSERFNFKNRRRNGSV
jgi:putative transposase